MRNPAFLIVCVLVGVTPLMRGAVHDWARTVIQILVAVGGIVLVLEALRLKERRKSTTRSKGSKDSRYTCSAGSGIDSPAAASNNAKSRSGASRKIISTWQLFWYVAVPCGVLGIWFAVMSPHPALAAQGLVMQSCPDTPTTITSSSQQMPASCSSP